MPTMEPLRWMPAGVTRELGVAEGEDPTGAVTSQ